MESAFSHFINRRVTMFVGNEGAEIQPATGYLVGVGEGFVILCDSYEGSRPVGLAAFDRELIYFIAEEGSKVTHV